MEEDTEHRPILEVLASLYAGTEAADETVMSYRPFVHPDDLGRFEEAMRSHLKDETETFECSYRTIDRAHTVGEWVPIEDLVLCAQGLALAAWRLSR